MRGRVELLLNLTAGGIWMGTFHAIGVRILRRDGAADGIDRHFVIYDEADRLAVVKRMMTEMRLDEKRYPPGGMVALISRAKDEVVSAQDQAKAAGTRTEELAAQIRVRYDAFLEQNKARFRRPPDADRLAVRSSSRGPREVSAALQVHHGRRVPGHEPGPVLDGPPPGEQAAQPLCRRRRRSVDLSVPWRRCPQHPVVRTRLSGRADRQAGAELPLDAGDPRRGLPRHQGESQPGGQATVDGPAGRAEGRGRANLRRARRGPGRRPRSATAGCGG